MRERESKACEACERPLAGPDFMFERVTKGERERERKRKIQREE